MVAQLNSQHLNVRISVTLLLTAHESSTEGFPRLTQEVLSVFCCSSHNLVALALQDEAFAVS